MVLDNGEDEIVGESLLGRIDRNSSVLPSRETLIGTHPKSAFRVFIDGQNNIAYQAVLFGQGSERAFFQAVESSTASAKPQAAFTIFENSPDFFFVNCI